MMIKNVCYCFCLWRVILYLKINYRWEGRYADRRGVLLLGKGYWRKSIKKWGIFMNVGKSWWFNIVM